MTKYKMPNLHEKIDVKPAKRYDTQNGKAWKEA
jgi:hypothetical protein